MRRAPSTCLLLLVTLLLLAGCTSAGGSPSASGSRSASASTGSPGPHLSTAVPQGRQVCRGQSVPDVVQRIEPQVVTVRTSKGLGSGIVYRSDIVLTDQHVVAREEGSPQTFSTVEVLLADGSRHSATVIASDLLTDLAVLRVKGAHLPVATFRKTVPRPGETVLAIGSPLGFSSSVTEGVVSALGRNLPSSPDSSQPPLVDLIQTDAPISPGNSGGALVDVCGQVVGVNEAYIPPSSGAVSLGFATPAVIAVNIADQLIANGKATHPSLGIKIIDLTPSIAQALGTDARAGVVVVQAVSGGPAAKAGIQRGDVITGLGGEPVSGYADLLGALRSHQPGDRVDVRVDRGGKERKLTVTVGSRR
jgi:serine protease Do